MKFKNFSLRAELIIQNARCNNCRSLLTEIPDGFFSSVWYCENCNSVYELRLIKSPNGQVSPRENTLIKKAIQKAKEIHNAKTR